ncbi:MAG: glycosyltransferase family 2 protein [Actinomycetota bacterium]|nr:glycosyltransferase family 2 protein [Actinomycetota bacterium]
MTSEPDSSSDGTPRALGSQALVSVLVAAYDEEATIAGVLEQVSGLGLNAELIVVDDGSSDGTPEILRRLEQDGGIPGLRVIAHPANRGKGAAIRTAIDASRGDVVVIQDADGEYDPADLPRVLAPIMSGHADAVYGTRLRGGQPQRAHLFWHYAGNRFLSLLTNVLYNTTISDMEVGHKAFRGELIRSLPLVSEGFSFEPEVTAKVLLKGVRLYEVPVSYFGRTYEEGKKITWRDGVIAVWTLLRYRVGL